MAATTGNESRSLVLFSRTPDHPPYAEMVSHALTALDEEAGSSESSISKHIQSNYDDLPPAHDNLLHYHLSKLTRLGEILQLSPGFYTVPHSQNPNPNPLHGRSSKLPCSTEPYKEKHRSVDNDPDFDVEERGSAPVRKGRGRPRKAKPAGHEKSGGPARDAGGGEVGLFPTEGAVEGGDGLIRGRLPKAKIRKDGDGVLRLEIGWLNKMYMHFGWTDPFLWTILFKEDIPRQDNSNDRGVFAVAFVKHCVHRHPITFT